MERVKRTPTGTPVGVNDPYEHAGVCDHATNDGRCRYAFDHPQHDPEFAQKRRLDDFRCPAAGGDCDWRECVHYRYTESNRECARCGLEERRNAQSDVRPLLEEHHLSYRGEDELTHEITLYLCRWCHAKIHKSWARLDDDVNPDTEAIAEAEGRRSDELEELGFQTAADRNNSAGGNPED